MFSVFYRVIETFVEVWENSEKLWRHSPVGLCFSFSQTSTRVSITRWKHGTCFLREEEREFREWTIMEYTKHQATLFPFIQFDVLWTSNIVVRICKESEVIWKWSEDIKVFYCLRALFFTRTFSSCSRGWW